jgi:hypothetical protein
VVQPYFRKAKQPGVVAIGVAQEFQSVFTATTTPPRSRDRVAREHPALLSPRRTGASPSTTTSTWPTRTSAWVSSSSAPTSPIPAKFGLTATSGPSVRPPRQVWLTQSWPTASPPASMPLACKPSATGWDRLTCSAFATAGWR